MTRLGHQVVGEGRFKFIGLPLKIRGGTETFLAWSEKPLPKGTTVLVIESRGARAVDVIEWDDVIGESPRLPG